MYFYIDESGQTGLNLFDKNQPRLFYGVLSSKLNIDVLVEKRINTIRKELGVDRLHAVELGNQGIANILNELKKIDKKYKLKFDLYSILKTDHALICFFDQTFDQGLNPALPWSSYWTPLRYLLLIKVAYLFDEELLQKAWEARITTDNLVAEKALIEVCENIIARVNYLPDARSRELITDGLRWVINNPSKIEYNISSKKESLQISPNLIGFQSVMHGIANRLKKSKSGASSIIVDQQSQFNSAQKFISDFYHKARDVPWVSGPGMPKMDLKSMPNIPINCLASTQSVGLELVDIYLWLFKRAYEKKSLDLELKKFVQSKVPSGKFDEVSLEGIINRWGDCLTDDSEIPQELLEKGKKLFEEEEGGRRPHVYK